jgi:PAS domain S-box-containing protein
VSAPEAVRLLDLPVRMVAAASEQWSEMLREYALRGFGGHAQPYRQDEISQAGRALAAVVDAAQDAGSDLAADVVVPLASDTVRGLSMLQGILDDVRQLIARGELLVLPPLPEIVALRNWIAEQAVEQTAGASPSPWRLASPADDPSDTAAAQWNESLAPPPDKAWLVGDDHNRIVAASPAALALLGWDDDLLGQRLLVVIPHALREAHIAGFTRSVVSGRGELLGKPLALPALRRDGHEVPITLTLTRHAARAGRHVYLAHLEPV